MTSRVDGRGPLATRLRIGREFSGLTKAGVGTRLGVSGSYVSQLESGRRVPNDETVIALGELYGFSPNFFARPLAPVPGEQAYEFRRLARTGVGERQTTMARAFVLKEFLAKCESEYELPAVTVPTLRTKDFASIEELTYQVRAHWQLTIDQPIPNVTRVLENAGVVVLRLPGISKTIDAFAGHGERPIIVQGLRTTSASRARSDGGHELGHLVMHRGLDLEREAREEEANEFSGAFLLPRIAFIRDWPRRGELDWDHLFEMKRRWRVSLSMIVYRAHRLGWISQVQMVSAFRSMRRQWGVVEPEEPPVEEPGLLKTAVGMLQEDNGRQVEDLLQDWLGWAHETTRLLLPAVA